MPYSEDQMLMLSGIQHYVFCPRQWALIQIEQLWEDNHLTTEGNILHENVDNPDYRVKNNSSIIIRRVSLVSKQLGFYGYSDAVEFIPTNDPQKGISYKNNPGYYIPMPIEYKRGKPKQDICDIMQLVCQVMCLEEMHNITIDMGALFYWETRRRLEIQITDQLRHTAMDFANKMHDIVKSCILPKPIKSTACKNCSLVNVCLPDIHANKSVNEYLKINL